jgi:protocatechuate 3,4-dioxygenase alpha subunit
MKLVPTAAQTAGPFFRCGLDRPDWSDLTASGAAGERIRIRGRVLDGDRVPVADALLEIWQADAAGTYGHDADADKPIDVGFRGFGRACTDADGCYGFTTIRPGRVSGPDGTMQAPHVALAIFARGLLRGLATRIYFDDGTEANEADPLLRTIAGSDLRRTMIASRTAAENGIVLYRFDVVLQGERETAFIDI